MAKATFVVFTNPVSADAEDEYNRWYQDVHLKDVLAIDGFVSAQRFRFIDVAALGDVPAPSHPYLALYEFDGDDVEATAAAMSAAAGTDAMVMSPALDGDNARAWFAEPIGARVTASS